MRRVILQTGRYALLVFVSLGAGMSTSTVAAGQFVVEEIADLNTPVPGGNGNFTWFGGLVSLGDGDVAFTGWGEDGFVGVYTHINGTLSKVVDKNTPIPDGTGNFIAFEQLTPTGAGVLIFFGSGAGNRQQGVYKSAQGTLTKIADMNTAIPEGTTNFGVGVTPFETVVSLGNGEIAFYGIGKRADGTSEDGIYRTVGGVLERVADLNTPIPDGAGNFTSFDRFSLVSLEDGNLAFVASGQVNDDNGIYAFVDGSLKRLADRTSPAPEGNGNFTKFVNLTPLGSGALAFASRDSGSIHEGIYKYVEGSFHKVADMNTKVPSGNGNFLVFDTASFVGVGGGSLAFSAYGDDGEAGIYTDFGGALRAIVDRTDEVPGGVGVFTEFHNPISLGEGNVTFRGYGSIAEAGIYSNLGGMVRKTVDTNTSIPAGEGDFRTFGVLPGSISVNFVVTGGKVAFAGSGYQGETGIYLVHADDGQDGMKDEGPPAIENLKISQLKISIDKRGQHPFDSNRINFRNIDKLTVKGSFRLDTDADPNRDLVAVSVPGVGSQNMCLTCSRPTIRKGRGERVRWKLKGKFKPGLPVNKQKHSKITFILTRKGDLWNFQLKESGRLGFLSLINTNTDIATLEVHVSFATEFDPYTQWTSKGIASIPVKVRQSGNKITAHFP